MVDSIKSQTNLSQSQSTPKRTSNNSLRQNFKSLSSGLSVSQALKDTPAVVHVQTPKSSVQVGKLVDNLNDAVKSSKRTLKALEDVSSAAEGNDDINVVQAFAEDLDQLKSDIVELLQDLRHRVSRAEVLSENMEAADTRLEDLERAQEKVRDASEGILSNKEEALFAHSFLNPGSVDRLLEEHE